MGIKEDEEDMRLEEEELKRKQAMKSKRKKTWRCWLIDIYGVKAVALSRLNTSLCHSATNITLFISSYQNRESVLHYQEPIFNSWALDKVIYNALLMPFFYIGKDHGITNM